MSKTIIACILFNLFNLVSVVRANETQVFIQDYDGKLFYGSLDNDFYVGEHPDSMELNHHFDEPVGKIVSGTSAVVISTGKSDRPQTVWQFSKQTETVEASDLEEQKNVAHLSFLNDRFFAQVDPTTWYSSAGGLHWNQFKTDTEGIYTQGIAYRNGTYVILSQEYPTGQAEPEKPFAVYSTDGKTWTTVRNIIDTKSHPIQWLGKPVVIPEGFIALTDRGYLLSENGVDWTFQPGDSIAVRHDAEFAGYHGGAFYTFDGGSLFKKTALNGDFEQVQTQQKILSPWDIRLFMIPGHSDPLLIYKNPEKQFVVEGAGIQSLQIAGKKDSPLPSASLAENNAVFIQDYDGSLFYGSLEKGFYTGNHYRSPVLKHTFDRNIVRIVSGPDHVVITTGHQSGYGNEIWVLDKSSDTIERGDSSYTPNISDLTCLNGTFFFMTGTHQWFASKTGLQWKTLTFPIEPSQMMGMAYNNGTYVILCKTHVVSSDKSRTHLPPRIFAMYSTNGETWQVSREMGCPEETAYKWVHKPFATRNGFIAKVDKGYILSEDGISWTFHADHTEGTLKASLNGLCYLYRENSIYSQPDAMTGKWEKHEYLDPMEAPHFMRFLPVDGKTFPIITYRTKNGSVITSAPVGWDQKPVPEPVEKEKVASKPETHSKNWITASYLSKNNTPISQLQTALVAAELDMPITALRICNTVLKSDEVELKEKFHALAARIHASLDEPAWAYHHEQQLKNSPKGVESTYWLGAVMHFYQCVMTESITDRLANPALWPEELIKSDQRLSRGKLDAEFWKARFDLTQKMNLDQDAAMAAANVILSSSDKMDPCIDYLHARQVKASDLAQQAMNALQEEKTDEALILALSAMNYDPVSHSILKSAYKIAAATHNDALAVSILSLRWQAGDETIDLASCLPKIAKQGDFSLLLSICASKSSDSTDWVCPYYLTLAAFAWDLPYLESQALRALADNRFEGQIFSIPLLHTAISPFKMGKDKRLSQNITKWDLREFGSLTFRQMQMREATLPPLENALTWNLNQSYVKTQEEKDLQEAILKEQSTRFDANLPHAAYLLGQLDASTYETKCTGPHDSATRNALLALIKDRNNTTQGGSSAVDFQPFLEDPILNVNLKAAIHCWISKTKELYPSTVRSSDPIFIRFPFSSNPQVEKRARQGAIVYAEVPYPKRLISDANLHYSTFISNQTNLLKNSSIWPEADDPVLWLGWDPRLRPNSATSSTDIYEGNWSAFYAFEYNLWLAQNIDISSPELSVYERTMRQEQFLDSIQDDATSFRVDQRTPARLKTASHRLKTIQSLKTKLTDREGDVLLFEFLHTAKVLDNDEKDQVLNTASMQQLKNETLARIKAGKKLDMGSELVFRRHAEKLFPPESGYSDLAFSLVSKGKTDAEVRQAVSDAQSAAFKAALARNAEIQRKKEEQEQAIANMQRVWAGQDAKMDFQQPEYAKDAGDRWADAIYRAALRQQQYKPEIIKNYNSNGTVDIIIRR
ncbi:WD40/YVTN/BNR-like repeat-containing protein [Pontiella agarivorans]|uniref:Uncharacterized protein n=1 Tax=Pontiella agarivorans TaxID=3038953 RepID=A0ABU5MZU3_9BACT|nr:hypothetical protein [Pontiella agarivorans]MDZ8119705.1 hypothetical protein [Pontiella agarivorans]